MERALSFGSVAHAYDHYRPELPREVCEWWGVAPGMTVVDVAAGTGLATRPLARAVSTAAAIAGHVVSVEPDDDMRRVLSERSPDVDARKGTGESIPAADASADVIAIVSAWHWLDEARAFAEAARVLRDGGTLGIAWNGADQREGWVSDLFALRRSLGEESTRRSGAARSGEHQNEERPNATENAHRRHDPRAIGLPNDAPFANVETKQIFWTWSRTPLEIVAWMGTYSGILTADAEVSRTARERAFALATEHADEEGIVQVPMCTRCWKAMRAPRMTGSMTTAVSALSKRRAD